MSTYDENTRKPYPEKARDRIRSSKIITKLQECVHGKTEMSPQQVAAARILLGKTLPDLKATEFVGRLDANIIVEEETVESAAASVAALLKSSR